jgi:peptide deformylase
MSQRTIINLNDPRLRQVSEPVLTFDADLEELAQDMLAEMERARGIGLAAVQLGVLKRVIVTCAASDHGSNMSFTLVNPVVSNRSTDCNETNEGCLSIPGVRLLFSRPSTVVVDYFDLHGQPHTLTATGMLATCIQHEIDHLDGILILDHVSKNLIC